MKHPYQVAIPSYDRPDVLKVKTLAMLKRLQCPEERITIFCASEEEAQRYEALGPRVIVGVLGLGAQRAFIQEHYPKGTRIISIDDDFDGLESKVDDKTLEPYRGTLDDIAEIGFSQAEANGVKLWGLALARNAMFLSQQIVIGLRYIGGGFVGTIAGHPTHEANRPSHGEDFAATLHSYTNDGAVMRINWLVPKTAFFSPGGMDAEAALQGTTRAKEHEAELKRIQARYPELSKIKIKAGGVTNLRLKDITKKRIAREDVEVLTRKAAPQNHTKQPLVETGTLKAREDSPFTHGKDQMELLTKVIQQAGYRAHVVVSERDRSTIVTGTLIWMVAHQAGWEVPVEFQTFDTEDDEKAHMLTDWRVSQYSRTDHEKVVELLEQLKGRTPEASGFRMAQINALFGLTVPNPTSEPQAEDRRDEDGVQVLQFLFTHEQEQEFITRATALMDATGHNNPSEAILAVI